MKKAACQKIYDFLTLLSNNFNSKFLTKCKVLLGISLIVMTGSCNDPDEQEIMCYDPMPEPEEKIIGIPPQSTPDSSVDTVIMGKT